MATLAVDVGAPYSPAAVSLCTALAGSVPTTNIIDRGGRTGPVLLEVITTVGATPTCTYLVEGSADGTSFFAIPYADPASRRWSAWPRSAGDHSDDDPPVCAGRLPVALPAGDDVGEHQRAEQHQRVLLLGGQ